MNPQETVGNSMTRRNFMKKTTLTVGAVTFLAQGIGLANETGGGCPAKTTKTNNGTSTQRRTDKWVQHTNKNTGEVFFLKTTGTPINSSGTQSPGNFPSTISFSKEDGKTCNYVLDAAAPVVTVISQTNWTYVSGTEQTGTNQGASIPNPAADWTANPSVSTEAVYSKSTTWRAIQSYILQ